MWRSWLSPAAGAGLIAGAAAGLAEAIWLVQLGNDWRDDYDLVLIGPLIYGLIGLMAGVAIGSVAAVVFRKRRGDGLDVFGFALGVVLAALSMLVFRFVYVRDVLQEISLSASGQAAWLGASVAIMLLCWLLLPRLLRGWTSGIALRGSLLAWFLLLGLAAVTIRVLPRAGTIDFRAQPAAPARPDILYLMVDTLRADHLSVYGARDVQTPSAARLAGDGVVFEQAISQAPWTRPSVATQLTSLPPHRHGARSKSTSIDPGAVMLAEVLADAGYYSVGLYHNIHLAPQWGFARGFHRYRRLLEGYPLRELVGVRFIAQLWRSWRRSTLRPGNVHLTAEQVFRLVRQEWEDAPKDVPVFLFVHLMDVHDPYFPRSTPGPAILRDEQAPAAMRDTFHKAYRDGVAYADTQLGELIRWMQATGRYDDTLIVLVSDHGEEFFEHGGYWHGLTLYEEQIHVPLILKLPQNQSAGSRQPALVRLLDLAPTIVAVAGVPAPPQWMGVPLIRDSVLVDPRLDYALSETDLEAGIQRALRGTRFKLIRTGSSHSREMPPSALFDLQRDALEQTNLASQSDEESRRLEATLKRERGGDLWR